MSNLKFNVIASVASLMLGASQIAMADDSALYNRAAVGDITLNGGASRVHADLTKLYADEVNNAIKTHTKNVILLIGDGMGDSEITAARNFAVGAGGSFKGIDALPFTGQYTHYSLDKKTKKPDYVTDSAASGSAWATGTKSYNGAISVDVNGKCIKATKFPLSATHFFNVSPVSFHSYAVKL